MESTQKARRGSATPTQLGRRGSTTPTGDEKFDHSFKVMLIGDSSVGKTSILVRYKDGKFIEDTNTPTVGIDYGNKLFDFDSRMRVKLQLWDTAGQERFRSLTHAYYRDAHVIVLIYDVTERSTYTNIKYWLAEIKEYASEEVIVVLVGNKCDITERAVREDEGEKLAVRNNIMYYETSAKTGKNIDSLFDVITRELMKMNECEEEEGVEYKGDSKSSFFLAWLRSAGRKLICIC